MKVSDEVGQPQPLVMPATDSELVSMEDPHALEDEEGSSTTIRSSVPSTIVPSSTPLDPTTMSPDVPSETTIETKAVSMASNDCSLPISSPAKASPAKPAATSLTIFEGTVETSPATSHIASATDSLTCTETSLVNISESPPLSLSVLPSTTFGSPDMETVFPTVLTFKGVSVTLENNSVWKQFNSCGTEMILTKQGRRMFPYCRYRLAGLDPERQYSLVLSIVPSDQYRYRWSTSKWEVTGPAEHQAQTLIRAFSHHYSPNRGSEWMGSLLSFYKLKLTNCSQDQDGHIILHSMHRYIPRLHVIPVPDGDVPTPEQPVVMGPESMTFTFPQTEFMAVTTYQNFRITQLKINHNPFAKGFREDGNNSRLNRITTEAQPVVKTDTHLVTTEAQPVVKTDTHRVTTEAQPVVKTDTHRVTTEAQPVVKTETHLVTTEAQPVVKTETHLVTTEARPVVKTETHLVTTEARPVVKTETQPSILKPAAELNEKEAVVDLSAKNLTVPASVSNEQTTTRLVLKPIMSYPSRKDEPYIPCIRGKHALGELVLFQRRPLVKPKEEIHAVSITPKALQVKPEEIPMTPTSLTSTPGSSPGYRKRRKRINKRWANSRGRDWKAAAASPTVFHSPSLTVAMQPELDDVEGLLFVSFTSKEALEVHIRDKPANSTPSASPVSPTTPMQWKEKMEVIPETDEEKIARAEAILLQDLGVLKHRQVIHPVLQEVGLKLSSLDTTKSIDLQYLGVHLPLPPPIRPEQGNAMVRSPGDEGLSFISRTGKTSDITKIKGWKNKFIRSKETSPSKCDGSQKNLSAFCSNMLDEYLESEAQYISERAAAFSSNSEGSVAYQLPVKSSSYVKTLDSVLKHRRAAFKFPVGANRPCPLSHKPLLYSVLASPPPPLASPATPVQAQARSIQQSASSHVQPVAPRLSTPQPGVSQRPAVGIGQSQGGTHRPGFTKVQLKLLQMELGAQSQGLSRTQLTPDRLSVALSAILSKQMLPSQVLKVAHCPKYKSTGPECGQEFCTLGCVCSSLRHLNRGPLHCRRPDCMFGCACFKRKITKQATEGEKEEVIQPVYSMTNMEHVVQPGPGSHSNKLWNHNIHGVDPEPIFTPKSPPRLFAPVKVLKRSSVARTTQPIREEDKDPVYKYLESMMTCARVREFNSKPPPIVTIEPMILDTSTPNTTAKPQATTPDDQLEKCLRTLLTVDKAAEKASQETISNESEAKKQIEIQSACKWAKDRKIVLKTLCWRMNQNRLSRRFWVGPYLIRPVAKIFMRKPSGSIVTYRVHISKPSKASDIDEDEYDDSDEEKNADESFDGNIDAEEGDDQNEESDMQFGVTPFLSGVLPAGRMRARTKPVGCQAYGLIQVNGKSYNQARLLLGNMGSLHPANRLAAFVTGRLHPPGGISLKNSPKSDPANKIPSPGALHIKAAGTVVPPIITARKTTDLKTPAQPPAQQFQPDSWKKGSINLPQHSQNSSIINSFVSGKRSSVCPFQNSSSSSPVSLTVSQSLKTPSFLGQSGTYSFRICPPANQRTTGQNLPGVTLPGGFTLIQLPKPGANGAASESVSTTNIAGVDKAQSQKDALFNLIKGGGAREKWCCLNAFTQAKDLLRSRLVEPGSSSELMCDEKMPSEESDETNIRQVDIASEDFSSDSSDYSVEGDEDDEEVDIETVEETKQGIAIAQMKEAVRKALKESGDSSDGFGSARELNAQDEMDSEQDDCKDKRRRKNHTVLERQRRSEQRVLFDKLQTVLKSDPRAPRLRLLSLAQKEIQNLVETSRCLQEKKRMLNRMQSLYVKELSVLSGKSDTLIKHKLKEICERQKIREKRMEWKPFFSHLLQSRAAVLQGTNPNSKVRPTPLLQPDLHRAPSQANPLTTSAQKKLMSLLQPNLQRAPAQSSVQTHMLQWVSSSVKDEVIAPSLHGGQAKFGGQQEIPGAQAQVGTSKSQTESSVAAQDGASLKFPKAKSRKRPVQSANPFALPLIRSKTGRIILPSSLKPLGHGFYTLTVMQPKQKGEKDDVGSSANDVDSSMNQDNSSSEGDHPLDLASSRILEDDKTVKSSNSKPKLSGATAPLAELALLNKSIVVPSVTLQAVENSQEGGPAVGFNKTLATACLSFQCVKQSPTAVEPVVRRGRGRPRKILVTPVSAKEKHAVVEDTSKSESETSILVEETQSEKITLELTKTQAKDSPGVVSDNPVPVKRGRGRPPKKKSAQLWSPSDVRARSPSKSNEDSPVRLSFSRFKSPNESPATNAALGEVNTSRPLTRGALGKDFPSAKKRSWIDVEKELEPELEFE
ncbi:MAX gene-associated protein isoform X3 [Cottoperca gobio]|uniref:MAX gene-associated protein isoform X3 n=1 Tax=Cottoperca gobio TaxID=56716 RepID=A0A6J2P5Y6_COTGO|nr:MAX gene-associated protein-like isoform X3 [Cottoperca gobio]